MRAEAVDAFSYAAFTGRNLGFVSAAEQARLRAARVFVCGAGGMGGAAIQVLVRAGVERLAVADPDRYEISNFNRQVFAALDTVGRRKAEVAVDAALAINPGAEIEAIDGDWTPRADDLLARYPIVVNAMDDVPAGVLLYRRARERGATVIDAYTSPLPSVTVVRPGAPRPEERLGFPTVGKSLTAITPADATACLACELAWVLANSSSLDHVDPGAAREFLAGRRPRPSFAPAVILTGTLMALEAIRLALGREPGTDERGYFFDPWTGRVERPRRGPAAWWARAAARRALRRLTA